MENYILEWIGYAASIIIALSMAINSVIWFRVVNLAGAALFSLYGFLIGSLPVGGMNFFIIVVDLYYIFQITRNNDEFEVLEVKSDNIYLDRYLHYYKNEIKKMFLDFEYDLQTHDLSLLVLKNMQVIGLFIAHCHNSSSLSVNLDYIETQHQDLKTIRIIYSQMYNYLRSIGFTTILSATRDKGSLKRLRKVGFEKKTEDLYVKFL